MELVMDVGGAAFIYRGEHTPGFHNEIKYPIICLDDKSFLHLRHVSLEDFELMVDNYRMDMLPWMDITGEFNIITKDN